MCYRNDFSFIGIDENAIKWMKTAYEGTQVAILSFPVETVVKMITASKVIIG